MDLKKKRKRKGCLAAEHWPIGEENAKRVADLTSRELQTRHCGDRLYLIGWVLRSTQIDGVKLPCLSKVGENLLTSKTLEGASWGLSL